MVWYAGLIPLTPALAIAIISYEVWFRFTRIARVDGLELNFILSVPKGNLDLILALTLALLIDVL